MQLRIVGREKPSKMIVVSGTIDTLASPGAQLDYHQSVFDTMGQSVVDPFARFFVIPHTSDGLSGTNYLVDGDGKTIPSSAIPNCFNPFRVLMDWVEEVVVPRKSSIVTAAKRVFRCAGTPAYPKYAGGPSGSASSYVRCALTEQSMRVISAQ